MTFLANKYGKTDALRRLSKETFKRRTVSFYRYVIIEDPKKMRDTLYKEWTDLGVLGRTYLAREGINAQINVPEPQWEAFVKTLYSHKEFKDVPFKVAVEQGESFWKLTIKVKKQIVADGLQEGEYDVTNVGRHLTAEEFNKYMENQDAIVVDMRNAYESRIGRFEGAVCPPSATFREELRMTGEMLKDKKDKKVLLYCTGGIRCEKASAYLKAQGFEDVNQLHGGIIQYAHEVKAKGLPSRFKGVNFVFDERLGERITGDVLTHCDQCGQPCDRYLNCANVICNLLFIQCDACHKKWEGCCSEKCQTVIHLPADEQKELRKHQKPTNLRPFKMCNLD